MRSISVQEIEKAYHLTSDAASMHMTDRDSNLTAPCQFSSPKLSYLSDCIFQKKFDILCLSFRRPISGYYWISVAQGD